MRIILDKQFETRADLDAYILSRFGNNPENIEHEIELTDEEAKRLSLSENTKVFGVRTKILKVK